MSDPNIPAGYNEDGEYTAGLPNQYIEEEPNTKPFEKKATLTSHPLFNTPHQQRINK